MPTLERSHRRPLMTPESAWSTTRRDLQDRHLSPFQQYRLTPTRKLRDHLIAANIGLAEKAARRWAHQCNEPWEDLKQEGTLGLIKAVERYDPATGYAFSSFAMPFISGAIQHYLRDKGWGQVRPPRKAVEQYAKVKNTQRRLAGMGRDLPDHEVAEGLGISRARWEFVREAREQPAPLSLDNSEIEIEDEREPTAPDTRILGHLAELPPMQFRCLVESVFGGLSDAQIGRRHRIVESEVRHCIDTAMAKLRGMIDA